MELNTILIAALAAAAGGSLSYIKAFYAKIVRNGYYQKKFWSEVSISTLAGVVFAIVANKEWDLIHIISIVFLVGYTASHIIQDVRVKITKELEQKLVEKLEGEKKNEP